MTADPRNPAKQDLLVRARGPDLLRCEPNATDPGEPAMPDPVGLFAACASLGMFSGPKLDPSASSAVVTSTRFDPETTGQTWRLAVASVDPGAFKVLHNLLAARVLDGFEILNDGGENGPSTPLPITTVYAGVWKPRFNARHDTPRRPSVCRGVSLVLVAPPEDPVLDAIYRALELWTNLVMLGGYAPDGIPPAKAGGLPDPAYLYDPVTIEQTFDEAFLSDEDAFNALFNWASRLDASGARVRELTVR